MRQIAALFCIAVLFSFPVSVFADTTPSPTQTASPSPTATATATATASPSPSATTTASPTASATTTASPTATATAKPKVTVAAVKKTATPSPTVIATSMPTNPPKPAVSAEVKSYSTPARTAKNPGIVSMLLVGILTAGVAGAGVFILRKNPKKVVQKNKV